jgi:outer membrane protein
VAAQQAELKIGFVDLQKIIDNSEKGKQIRNEIQKKADELTRQVKALEEEMKAMKADYDKQANVLTSEAKQEKRDELARKELDYQRFIKDSEAELRKAEKRALQELYQDIGKLISEYGKERNYTAIFERQTIVYVSESIDLTNDIIELYNSQ